MSALDKVADAAESALTWLVGLCFILAAISTLAIPVLIAVALFKIIFGGGL